MEVDEDRSKRKPSTKNDTSDELRQVKDMNRRLLHKLQEAESRPKDQIQQTTSVQKLKSELEENKKLLRKANNDLQKEKDLVKNTMNDIDEKNRKIIDLENSYARIKLMFEQTKEIAEKKCGKEVRFDINKKNNKTPTNPTRRHSSSSSSQSRSLNNT